MQFVSEENDYLAHHHQGDRKPSPLKEINFNHFSPKKKKERLQGLSFSIETTPARTKNNVKINQSKTIPLHIKNPTTREITVSVLKFPSQVGFHTKSYEFTVGPKDDYIMEITWTPVEKGNFRECTVMKTDTNIQVNVILFGSAEEKLKPKKGPRRTFLKENKVSHKHWRKTTPVQKRMPKSLKLEHNEVDLRSPFEFKQKDSFPDTDFIQTPVRRTTFVVAESSPLSLKSDMKSFDIHNQESHIFDDSLEIIETIENINCSPVHKDFSLLSKSEPFSKNPQIFEGTDSINEMPQEIESTDLIKPRKKWDIPPMLTVTDEIFNLKHVRSKFNNFESKSNVIHDDTFDGQETNFVHINSTSDFSFLPPHDQGLDIKRCSTGIKAKLPPLHLTEPKNFISASFVEKELFPTDSVFLSNENRLSSETFTTSTPSSPSDIKFDNLYPVNDSTEIVEQSISNLENIEQKKLPIIHKETTMGYMCSPYKKPFKRSVKSSPRKTIVSKRNVNNRLNTSKKVMVNKRYPKKPTKTEQLRKKVALEKSKSFLKKPVPGVPQRKLTLIKPKSNTIIPHHPNPFAAKNMFYDERWIEKQERGFTRWLNFFLTPPEDFSTSNEATKVDAGKLWIECSKNLSVPKAPTKEDLSFKAYTAKKRLNRLRKAACILYQSEPMIRVISKLEAEIEKERILIRDDRAVHVDLGIKQKILDMILCYNSLWLRIGLETIFGEILPLSSNNDVLGMSRFIVRRVLNNPHLAAQYAHPSVPYLYRPGYDQALKKFTLKKFLLLTYFLDRAKLTRLIDHDPCLFCINATFKSSKELLHAFSRDYLRGEGDLTKHLTYFGYVVSHKQSYLEEFNYAVENISVDLRCGIRLMKVTLILLKDWSLLNQARVPVISKLQKIHNVGVAFKALENSDMKIGGGIAPKDICAGHREKTLNLLWQMIFKFQIEILLNKCKLSKEISYLHQNLKLLRKTSEITSFLKSQNNDNAINMYYKSECLQLLMQWCQAVCSHYNMKIENFTVSFSDGRALCYLIHHYHPSLIPLSKIHTETTQTKSNFNIDSSSSDDSFQENWTHTFSPTTNKASGHQQLLVNEKKNFKLAFEKLEELGGVPILTQAADMSDTIPDEKIVITLITYLNIRLMDLSDEIHAARVIKLAWCNYKIKKELIQREIEEKAAIILQHAARKFLANRELLKQSQAACTIQAHFKSLLLRRKFIRIRAAVKSIQKFYRNKKTTECNRNQYLSIKYAAEVIQRTYRAKKVYENYHMLKQSTIVIQSYIRAYQQKRAYCRLRRTCCFIQNLWRSRTLMKFTRERFLNIKISVIKIQSWYRCKYAERKFAEFRQASILIQAHFRRYHAQKQYFKMKQAVLKIEEWYCSTVLMKNCRKMFITKRFAAILIQASVRRQLEKQKYQIKRVAAIRIQTWIRSYQTEQAYKRKRASVITLQRYYRLRLQAQRQRKSFIMMKRAAIIIQNTFRTYRIQKQFCLLKLSAIVIQKFFRAFNQRKYYLTQVQSAKVIQRHYRLYRESRIQHETFLDLKNKVTILQSHWRRIIAVRRKSIQKLKLSAIIIQSWWRMLDQHRKYQKLISFATLVQNHFKNKLAARQERENYIKVRNLVIFIQSKVRALICRKKYLKMKHSAIILQSTYRMHHLQKQYKSYQRCTLIIQQRFRAQKLAQKQFRCYHIQRGATIYIQSWFRRIQAQQFYLKQRQACILIQAHVRRMIMANQYQEYCKAVIQIQRRFRAKQLAVQTYTEFHEIRGAVIVIQSAFRMWRVQRTITKWHYSATKIQSLYRSYMERKRYQKIKSATVVLQLYVRIFQEKCKIRANYIAMKEASVVIQTYFRRHLAMRRLKYLKALVFIQSLIRRNLMRKEFIKKRNAALVIQKYVRCFLKKQQYLNLINSTIIIQRYFRAKLFGKRDRKSYIQQKNSCIKIQAFFRGCLIRKEWKKKVSATICIQKYFRSFVERQKFKSQKIAIIKLQRKWLATLLAKKERENYLKFTCGIVKLQAITRDGGGATLLANQVRHTYLQDRKNIIFSQACVRRYLVLKDYSKKRQAVIRIQSSFKGHLEFSYYKKQKNAVVVLQRRWRAYKIGEKERYQYQSALFSIIKVQAIVRGYLARKNQRSLDHSAIIIQKWFKCQRQRKKFLYKKKATATLQKYFRATINAKYQQKHYKIIRTQIILLQAFVRGYLVRKHYLKQQNNAVIIQSFYRAYHLRKKYVILKKSCVVIQRKWRSYRSMVQQKNEYLNYRKYVITCQSSVRRYICMKKYKKKLRAATIIQTAFRGFKIICDYKKLRSAATCIQTWWKNYILMQKTRSQFIQMKTSAVEIQRVFRGFLARKEFNRQFTLVCKMQANIKRNIAQRKYLQFRAQAMKMLQKHKAARKIQAFIRKYQRQEKYKLTLKWVVIVQNLARRFLAKKKLHQLKRENFAAKVIQSYFKQHMIEKNLKEEALKQYKRILKFSASIYFNLKAIAIQRYYRHAKVREHARKKLQSVLMIQRCIRGWLTRTSYLKMRHGFVLMQQLYKARLQDRHAKATIIQSYVRCWLTRRKAKQRLNAILIIQSSWRSYKVRKGINSKKLKNIRLRLKIASKEATEDMKLCHRTKSALDYLLGYKSITTILAALQHLDVVTRLSSVCCEKLAEGNAVETIFTLVKSCNRSLPHMEVIKYSVNILLNLSKYDRTVASVHVVDGSLDTLLELMTIFREKGEVIFTKCATLLWIIIQDNGYSQTIRNVPTALEKIKSLNYLVNRKQKLKDQRSSVKAKLNSSKINKIILGANSERKLTFKIQPDWILGKSHFREFSDPLCSMTYVMKSLFQTKDHLNK
ncbi:Abnormal spindle-like microcephaly-associated [Nymphon striatum]|nr:Abnormal spindle-like microcephaly-associated [Nymphon striatum]